MKMMDTHCDTLVNLWKNNGDLFNNNIHVSIEKLNVFESPVMFFAVFLDSEFLSDPFNKTFEAIKYFKVQVEKYKNYISICTSSEDLKKNMNNGKISAILTIEGGEAIEGKMENLYRLYEIGVRLVTLTWSRVNELGYGVKTEELGLTDFGKDVVREMNNLGMIVDVSHLSVKGFWDVYEHSSKPFIASHSNCLALCNNVRNLADDQIKAIIEKKGLIGLNMYPFFLEENGCADISHIVKHVEHILNLGGSDVIGLGGDFDGIETTPKEIDDVSCYRKLYDALTKNFGSSIADKIFFENCFNTVTNIL